MQSASLNQKTLDGNSQIFEYVQQELTDNNHYLTGPYALDDGKQSAPSLFFLNSSNSGFFLSGTNGIGITTNGSQRQHFHNTYIENFVPNRAVDGDYTTPAYAFKNSTDTGMIWDNAGAKVEFVHTGGPVFNYDVNKITTLQPLEAGDGSANFPAYSFTNDSDCGLYRSAPNDVRVSAGNSDVCSFNNSNFTLFKSLSNASMPYRTYRASATTTLVTGSAVLVDYATDITAQKQGTIINRSATGTYTLSEVGVYLVIYTFSTTSVSPSEQMMFAWANLNNNTTGAGTRYGEMILQRDGNTLGQQGSFFIKTTATNDYVAIFGYRGGGSAGNFPGNTTDNNFIQIIKVF